MSLTVSAAIRAAVVGGAALALVPASVASAAPELVANGGFEDPVVGSSPFIANTTTLTDWTVAAGDIDVIGTYWQHYAGSQSIDLQGCSAGTIRQAITTTPGAQYLLSFAVAGNPDVQGIKSSTVLVGTTVGGSDLVNSAESFDTTGKSLANMGWELRTKSFTAATTTSYIQFNDTSASTCFGIALDGVSVVETVPVPQFDRTALLAVGALGVVGVAALGLRRRPATN
jgi:choice-of-anchor C domain-containing protein